MKVEETKAIILCGSNLNKSLDLRGSMEMLRMYILKITHVLLLLLLLLLILLLLLLLLLVLLSLLRPSPLYESQLTEQRDQLYH